MIRNFKRPIEPLIGTAGRVRKIGFSTRVSPKNERFHEGWTVINLSCVRGPGLEDKTGEFCLNVSKTRPGTTKQRERERKGKSSVDGFSKLDENPRAEISRVFETFEGKISEHRFEF